MSTRLVKLIDGSVLTEPFVSGNQNLDAENWPCDSVNPNLLQAATGVCVPGLLMSFV